jgi:hypothetical protein
LKVTEETVAGASFTNEITVEEPLGALNGPKGRYADAAESSVHEATRTGAAPAYAYCAGMVVKAAERARDAINIVVPPDIRHSISSN